MLQRAALGKHHPFTLNWYVGSFFTPHSDGFPEWRGDAFWAILCFGGAFSTFGILNALPMPPIIRGCARNFVLVYLVYSASLFEGTSGMCE